MCNYTKTSNFIQVEKIKKGSILVGNKKVHPNYVIKNGDQISSIVHR